ncbi:MAG TPA: hypothetical protein VGD67_08470 [Pseudonocardiaceae bacterium]
MTDPDPQDALRAEIEQVERDAARHVDPGRWVMTVAVCAVVLLLAAALPWVGSANGWQVLLGQLAEPERVGPLPRLFATSSLLFGVVLSAVTVFNRRWGLVWLCAFGCAFSVVHAIWSVWSRQTSGSTGPGVGMVLALFAILVLAVTWVRLAFSRPPTVAS